MSVFLSSPFFTFFLSFLFSINTFFFLHYFKFLYHASPFYFLPLPVPVVLVVHFSQQLPDRFSSHRLSSISPYGICGRPSGDGAEFSPSIRFKLVSYHSTNKSHALIHIFVAIYSTFRHIFWIYMNNYCTFLLSYLQCHDMHRPEFWSKMGQKD